MNLYCSSLLYLNVLLFISSVALVVFQVIFYLGLGLDTAFCSLGIFLVMLSNNFVSSVAGNKYK